MEQSAEVKQSAESEQPTTSASEQPTTLSIVEGSAGPLSLRDLERALNERGVKMPYSSLSAFIQLGDVSEQLGVSGQGNKREFPHWTAGFLAEFIPWYQKTKLNKELVPDAVRNRLSQFRGSEKFLGSQNSITPQFRGSENLRTPENARDEEVPADLAFYDPGRPVEMTGPAAHFFAGLLKPLAGLPAALHDLASAVRELREVRTGNSDRPGVGGAEALVQDRLLTAEQAAEILACKPRSVGRHVSPVSENPRRYRESDIFRHIKYLAQIDKPKIGE